MAAQTAPGQATQAQLRTSEIRYRRLFETAHDGILMLDFGTRQITDANPFMVALLGYTRDELVGKELWQIGFLKDAAASASAFLELQASGSIRYEDLPLQTKAGECREVEFVSNVYAEDEQQVIQCNIRDITERRQAEAALRESEQTLCLSLEAAHIGHWDLDLVTHAASRSLQHDRVFGYEALVPNWTYEMFLSHVHPEDREWVDRLFQAGVAAKTEWDFECRIIRRDGALRWVWVHGTVFTNTAGDAVRMRGMVSDITARKQAEVTLEQLHLWHALILDSVEEGIHGIDAQGRIIFENPAAAKMLGWDVNELIGKPAHPTIHHTRPDGTLYPQEECHIYATLRDGAVHRAHDEVFWRQDGTSFPVEYVSTPLRNEQQEVMGSVVAFRDITERKQAAVWLTESRQRLALATESAHIGIWDWDVKANKMIWDAQMYALYGIREDNFTGADETWQRGLHPEDREKAEADITAALNGSRDFHSNFRVSWLNGEVRHIEAHGVVQRAADGSAVRMIGVNWDITERKLAENALRRSESLFRALVQNSWNGFQLVQPGGVISYESATSLRLLGYLPEEMEGHNALEFVHPDDAQAVMEGGLALVGVPGSTRTVVLRVRHKDGSWRWIESYDINLLDHPDVGAVAANYRDITAHKEAEEAQARLVAILEATPDFVGIADTLQHPIYINRAGRKMMGLTEDEDVSNTSIPDYFAPSARIIENEGVMAAIRDGVWSGETTMLSRSGQEIPVSQVIIAHKTAAGELELISTVARDITSLKQGEMALEERARIAALGSDVGRALTQPGTMQTTLDLCAQAMVQHLDAAFARIWTLNEQDNVLELQASAGLYTHLDGGHSRVPVGQFKIGLIAAERQPHLTNSVIGDPRVGEQEWARREGMVAFAGYPLIVGDHLVGVMAMFSRQKLSDFRLRGLDAVADEIALGVEHKLQAQALRESEEYFRFLNDLTEATRPLADPEQIMAVMARMLGEHLCASRCAYADVEQDGEEFTILHDYTDGCASTVGNYQLSLFGARAVATLYSGQTLIIRNVEAELLPSEGADMFNAIGIQAIITCPLLKDGVLRAMMAVHQTTPRDWKPSEISIVQDVIERCWSTIERRTAEGRIYQLNADLEQRVTERTTQLETVNTDLQAAREVADTANMAKSEFLSRMSHELRTPMNAILGFGQILELRDLGPKESQSVEHILKAGRHLLGLINEVLEISRIEAGHLSLSLEPIPVAAIVSEVLDLVRPLAAQRHIQLANEVAQAESWHVLADRQRLKQVLINLLSNAVKYNTEGGLVTVTCAASASGRLQIRVTDTGPGLAPEGLRKLFVPFERLNAGQTGVEGTGLGLVVSRHLTDAMGGTLTATSVPGQGSVFTMEMPVAESPLELVKGLAGSGVPTEASLAPRRVFTVLSIEDNASNYQLIEAILEARPGIQLIGATQGSTGLDLAQQHCPDLILLDLHLPDIMGWEVLRLLRESPATRDIPVVVISADATEKQIEHLLTPPEGHRGADAYLTKPLNVTDFLRVVDAMLHEHAVLEVV